MEKEEKPKGILWIYLTDGAPKGDSSRWLIWKRLLILL